eukprot:CAMPEP_0202963896 /NCGR_PEP_ID=MMETSP1396-20130829/7952_1 /ASSEMBLY_ACC=CAM_ASM_000872 /TAXON_ID= /ORGANISM="Pseudokeronopsis sp., Strain Brazil" /LENGTH=38 /DNA_ID= /DNA_START= /DNA_END= /DNA_ORIENTATION=
MVLPSISDKGSIYAQMKMFNSKKGLSRNRFELDEGKDD